MNCNKINQSQWFDRSYSGWGCRFSWSLLSESLSVSESSDHLLLVLILFLLIGRLRLWRGRVQPCPGYRLRLLHDHLHFRGHHVNNTLTDVNHLSNTQSYINKTTQIHWKIMNFEFFLTKHLIMPSNGWNSHCKSLIWKC